MDVLNGMGWESITAVVPTLIVTVLNGLFGYRLRTLWIAVWGFVIGLFLGMGIAAWFTNTQWIILVAGLAAAVVGALLAYRLYIVGIFLICALAVGSTVLLLVGRTFWWQLALAAVAAVLGGVLGVMFVRPAVIATTSISAGTATVSSVMGLLGYRNDTVTWALMAVLSAVFILFQLKNAKD